MCYTPLAGMPLDCLQNRYADLPLHVLLSVF